MWNYKFLYCWKWGISRWKSYIISLVKDMLKWKNEKQKKRKEKNLLKIVKWNKRVKMYSSSSPHLNSFFYFDPWEVDSLDLVGIANQPERISSACRTLWASLHWRRALHSWWLLVEHYPPNACISTSPRYIKKVINTLHQALKLLNITTK